MSDIEFQEPRVEREAKDIRVFCLFTESQYDQMRELGKIYGTRYIGETIIMAMKDALEHLDCPTPAELAALQERADEAGANYAEKPEEPGEVAIEDEEPEEYEEGEEPEEDEVPTLETEAVEFAEGLDPKGKAFLAAQLSEPYSTRTRTLHLGGARPDWQDKIIAWVNDACGWSGRKEATRETTAAANETRKNLLAYLKQEGVLPK